MLCTELPMIKGFSFKISLIFHGREGKLSEDDFRSITGKKKRGKYNLFHVKIVNVKKKLKEVKEEKSKHCHSDQFGRDHN